MRKAETFIFLLFLSSQIFSQGLFETAESVNQFGIKNNLNINGWVRGSVYGGSPNYDFTTIFGELGIQTEFSPQKAYLFADVRIREGIQFNENQFRIELKEAYGGYRSDKFDIYLGNQVVTWGRTDGFNPTNNISSNDYFFLSAKPDDQKLPNFMLRAKYRITPFMDVELIGIPVYRPSVYRYDLFSIAEGVSFISGELPEKTLNNSTVAARLNFDYSAIGYSFSWFHGYDPFYGFDVSSIDLTHLQEPAIEYQPDYYSKDAFGADIAVPLGNWIIRVEAAYNLTSNYKEHMYIPNPDIAWVAGMEHDFFGIKTIFQYIGKYVMDFYDLEKPVLDDPTDIDQIIQYARDNVYYESEMFNRKIFLQQEKLNHAVMLTLTRTFFYDALQADITAYYNFTAEDYFLRPGITWFITDELSTTAGANFMIGPKNSLFDYAGDVLNGVFCELRVTF